jgi:hypothetical protein
MKRLDGFIVSHTRRQSEKAVPMSTVPIRQAQIAPPLPTKNPRLKYLVIGAAGVALFGCLAFSCGSLVTYGLMRTKASDSGAVPVGKLAGKPTEQWNWQDLQDHLGSKGMKTGRGDGGFGQMWFFPEKDKSFGIALRNNVQKSEYEEGVFLVTEHGSADGAKREAARIKDVEQRDVFAWSKFVFASSPETRAKLKTLLP